MAKTVQVSLPADLAELLTTDSGQLNAKVRQALVLQLFQEGVVSSGKAAEILEISEDSFRSLLKERGISYFRQSAQEVARDADAAASAASNR